MLSSGCSRVSHLVQRATVSSFVGPYLGAGNVELDLAAVGAHELGEVLGDGLEQAEPVVLGEGLEEVLDDAFLVLAADQLLQLGDDLLLVALGEGRGGENLGELRVLLEDVVQVLEGLGDGLEGGGLGGSGVLWRVGTAPSAKMVPDCGLRCVFSASRLSLR